MKKQIRCIVKNNIYEVEEFDKESNPPANTVMVDNSKWFGRYRDYELINGVKAHLQGGGIAINATKRLVFTFKDTLLKKLETKNFQTIADFLNMFHEMSSEELDAYILKANNETKTALEEEITELSFKKRELERQLKKYIKIAKKKAEIDQLIKELNQ